MSTPLAHVAYIVARFPKLTETFVLHEIRAMASLGVVVGLYPLWHARGRVVHPEALSLLPRANFVRVLSWEVVRANWRLLWSQPRTYLRTLGAVVRGTWGNARLLCGGLAAFPKAVCFAERMKARGVTHVHAHFATHSAVTAFVIHRITGIPYSFTGHGSDLHRDRRMLREKIAEAAFAVTISDYNRTLMTGECADARDRQKVRVVRCGVDTQVFRPRTDGGDQARAGGPLSIGCVGTLHEVKGQIHLIRAGRLLADMGIDFALHFVGNGPDRQALVRAVHLNGLDDRVTFHGEQTGASVAELLRTLDVLVAPSVPTRDGRREGIPVALMEAMSTAVPVVASRLSGIPELVEHERTGLLVPPGDPHALAQAVARLHADATLRDRLGQAGRARILADYNVAANAAKLASLFKAGGEGLTTEARGEAGASLAMASAETA